MTCISHKIGQSQGGVSTGKGSDTTEEDYSYFAPTTETADLSTQNVFLQFANKISEPNKMFTVSTEKQIQ